LKAGFLGNGDEAEKSNLTRGYISYSATFGVKGNLEKSVRNVAPPSSLMCSPFDIDSIFYGAVMVDY
jgi:hypothetical protein